MLAPVGKSSEDDGDGGEDEEASCNADGDGRNDNDEVVGVNAELCCPSSRIKRADNRSNHELVVISIDCPESRS